MVYVKRLILTDRLFQNSISCQAVLRQKSHIVTITLFELLGQTKMAALQGDCMYDCVFVESTTTTAIAVASTPTTPTTTPSPAICRVHSLTVSQDLLLLLEIDGKLPLRE